MLRKALLVVLTFLGVGYFAYRELAPDGGRTTLVETDRFLLSTTGPWRERSLRPEWMPTWLPEDGKLCVVELINGTLYVEWKTVADGGGPVVQPSLEELAARQRKINDSGRSPLLIGTRSVAGFRWVDGPFTDRIYNRGMRCRILMIPMWFVVTALLAYPAVAFIRGPCRRMIRRWRGLCVACGYDLTGNESGVCPECATEVRQP